MWKSIPTRLAFEATAAIVGIALAGALLNLRFAGSGIPATVFLALIGSGVVLWRFRAAGSRAAAGAPLSIGPDIALSQSEAIFHTFIERAPAAVAMFDTQMRYIAYSARWVADYRLDAGDSLIGRSHYEVFPEITERWKEIHRRCLQGMAERSERDPFARAAGALQWLQWEVLPWRGSDGRIGGIVMFTRDVTAQVEAEQQLAQSELRFRTLVENTDVIVWQYDAALDRIVYVSPQAARLGYPLEEWLEPGFWHRTLHPDDRDAAVAFCLAETAHGRAHRFQYRMLAADGRVVWIDDHVSVELRPGSAPLLRGVFVDITDRKRAEEELGASKARLSAVIDTALDAVITMDSRGRVTAWNRQAEASFGYTATEAVGSRLDELIVPEELRAIHRDGLERYTRTGEARVLGKRVEVPAIRKGGERIIVELAINPIHSAQGVMFSAFLRDITPRKKAEAELAAAREAAEAANRAKSEFLANMSHEIRTPMTAILGYADLLRELDNGSNAPAPRLAYIDTIRRNGEHLLSIINDILDLSKIEAGKMTIDLVPLDLRRLLSETEALMQVKARSRGIDLHITLDTAVPAVVTGDAVRVRQILVNLIGNAIKFTEAGSVAVRVSFSSQPKPLITIRVVDSGIGMSREQMSRLFGAFEQADSGTTRRFGGTGLGLSISRHLAIRLGGDIAVESEQGRGSTFTFTLPTAPDIGSPMIGPTALLSSIVEAPVPAADSAQGLPLSGLRIYFAEDGPDNQRLISHHLRKAGAVVTIFENGLLLFRALTVDAADGPVIRRDVPCDLVLSDMQMPELDGYTLSTRLRELGWTKPIVALTAHAMSDDAERCFRAGCDRYVSKPMDRDRLIEACRYRTASSR